MNSATAGAEEKNVMVKTAVWWDIENCEVPKGCDVHAIAQNVSSALLKLNYCGPVSITAYGDTNLIPRVVQQALSSTGVGLSHVPAGVKDASDKKILVDMLLWAIDNPAPANIMLISGDRDFSNALHQLRMRRYTILLAQPQRASVPLVAAARNVWLWTSLAVGDHPLTIGESSQVVSNGHYQFSTSVSEQAKSSKETDSISNIGDTTDHNKQRPQNVASRKPQASVSVADKPIREPDVKESVWCEVCLMSFNSKDLYVSHTYGKRHGNNLEIQSAKESLEKLKNKNKNKDENENKNKDKNKNENKDKDKNKNENKDKNKNENKNKNKNENENKNKNKNKDKDKDKNENENENKDKDKDKNKNKNKNENKDKDKNKNKNENKDKNKKKDRVCT